MRHAIEERITVIMKTKKLTIGVFIISIILVICIAVPLITSALETEKENATPSIENKEENGEENGLSGEVLAYVNRLDGATIAFDIIEWVLVPGERATELGITDYDAPNGFMIYNETVMVEELPLADNCEYKILGWTPDSYSALINVTKEDMASILEEQKVARIPYHLIIENKEVIGIVEQYIP